MHKITRSVFLKTLCGASSLSLASSADALARPDPRQTSWLNPGLGMLPMLIAAESRQVSPENPTGEKGMGGESNPQSP